MLSLFSILAGKTLIFISKNFNLGSGSTWPGHIALSLDKKFINKVLKNSRTKIIIVAGTNGKTTTGKLIAAIFEKNGKSIIHNKAGANLLNGLASILINNYTFSLTRPGLVRLNQDYLIFECDENALPRVLVEIKPDYIVCLNLFRDQLDRYGEIDSIAKKWHKSFEKLTDKTTIILNADDPEISFLSHGIKTKSLFFGLDQAGDKKTSHGADSTHCPRCSNKLEFSNVFFSHLGIWKCPNCKLTRPEPEITKLKSYPLSGTYNEYNALAAYLVAKNEDVTDKLIDSVYQTFVPAFGRGEKLTYKGKNVQIFLSKNPTSFNESLSTVKELGGKNLLFILNDRIPDGLDVSWIWDINLEENLTKDMNIAVSGDRVYDMATRLKYAEMFTHVDPDYSDSLDKMIENLETDETLFILPNYSAMLDIRKTLTGRKIL